MITAYTIGFSVFAAVFALAAARWVVILSRLPGPLWRAIAGRPGSSLRLCVAMILADVVQLASGGRDGVGARLGLSVASAILVYSGVVCCGCGCGATTYRPSRRRQVPGSESALVGCTIITRRWCSGLCTSE